MFSIDPARIPPTRPTSVAGAVVFVIGGLTGGGLTEEPRLADLLTDSSSHRRSLSEFVGTSAPLAIEGTQSGLDIEIALSPRFEVLGGEFEIFHEHAPNQAGAKSDLRIHWDNREVPATSTTTGDRGGKLSGKFPGSPESLGTHQLKIVSEQHRVLSENAPSGGLWTQINARSSGITIQYRLRPIQPMLDELRDLIDERHWGDYVLTIVTAPLYSVGEKHLNWGNRVAQRSAIWMGRQPLEIHHRDQLSDTGDHIAIGTRAEMIGILPKTICDQITSSFVGLYPHPRNDRQFLLVLSGTDEEGVARAVRAFSFAPDQFPALPRIDVTGWAAANDEPVSAVVAGSRSVTMPDLERWRTEGFPGVAGGVGTAGCDLWITARDSATLASAWMVAGKLAQVSGDVIPSLAVIDRQPADSRHWFALGPLRSIGPEIKAASPLARIQPEDGEGLLAQFESPLKRGLAGGLLTATDSLILRDRISELIRPTLWETIHGDTMVWQLGGAHPRHQRLAATFESGQPGRLLFAWRWLAALPWLSILLSTIGALIVVWLLRQPMTSGRDWDVVPAKTNANRRVSPARRQREVARRQARLAEASRRGH